MRTIRAALIAGIVSMTGCERSSDAQRSDARNMLKQLDAAIQNYHSTYAEPKHPEAATGRGNPDEN